MWDEVQDCVQKNKHELRITGKALEKRLEDSDGRVPESVCATGPLFTFVELSSCAGLTQLPNNVDLMTNLHGTLVSSVGCSFCYSRLATALKPIVHETRPHL